MKQRTHRRSATRPKTVWIAFLGLLATTAACAAAPGKYSLDLAPTKDTRSFKHAQVETVQIGVTEDSIAPEVPAVLTAAIMEAILEEEIYVSVGQDIAVNEPIIQVACTVTEFKEGSRAARWLIGFGAGKGHLDLSCRFLDKVTSQVIAEGTFSDEVRGGVFGGGVDQEKMSTNIGKAIARFLKKGK